MLRLLSRFAPAGLLLLASCQTASVEAPAVEAPAVELATAPPSDVRCAGDAAWIDTSFAAGAFQHCEFSDHGQLVITLSPEDDPPINCSAWYAFRVTPRLSREITARLNYEACGHRYWPKISLDGEVWTRLPQDNVVLDEGGEITHALVGLPALDQPYFIAAQEIIAPRHYDQWLEEISASPDATRWELGKSAQGRSIPAMSIVEQTREPLEQVVLIGRQHPPEVTGFFALRAFTETILADTGLARDFRRRFAVTLVPMLNPDGVVLGHWRHSTGHVDLNRDWGPFTQPETRLMDELLQAIEADPQRDLRLFLDFHSTQRDIFYTIPDDRPTDPPMFISQWLDRLEERMPDYEVNRDANHNPTSATSKGYVFQTYGAPTTTFEIGDETDRNRIEQIGREAAISMMEVMLATEPAR